jgi:CubicO group peptidase (beta-lactamase class C family)
VEFHNIKRNWSTLKEADMDENYICELYRYTNEQNINIHSILILRDGNKVLETYAHPFDSEARRDVFSASKSFLSAAIGIAVKMELLRIDDKIGSFFPDEINTSMPYIEEVAIKHLLTMSVGQTSEDFMKIWNQEDWVYAFLNTPITHKPGYLHEYNNFCSFMLSAIIQKVSGMRLLEFLDTYLFRKIGIQKTCWLQPNKGIDFGASGLYLTAVEMALFGQLLLNDGNWNGEQIIDREYLQQAVTKQIEAEIYLDGNGTTENCGYGYHFWINNFGGYSASGMLLQEIVVLKEYGVVAVILGGISNGTAVVSKLISNYIIPACNTGYTGENLSLKKSIACFESEAIYADSISSKYINFNKFYNLSLPIEFFGVFDFIKTRLTGIGLIIKDKEVTLLYKDSDMLYRLKCGINNLFIVNKFEREVSGDIVDYKLSLRGRWENNMFLFEIQPLASAYRIIGLMDFKDDDNIELEIYYDDRCTSFNEHKKTMGYCIS